MRTPWPAARITSGSQDTATISAARRPARTIPAASRSMIGGSRGYGPAPNGAGPERPADITVSDPPTIEALLGIQQRQRQSEAAVRGPVEPGDIEADPSRRLDPLHSHHGDFADEHVERD